MNPPLGKNSFERLNYSIHRIASVSDGGAQALLVPRLSNLAIQALRKHWSEFYQSAKQAGTPQMALAAKLDRYADWYTRAWAILPVKQRALVPSPGEIDTSFTELARQTLDSVIERGRTIADEAVALRKSIESAGMFAGMTGMIGLLLGAAAAWYLLRNVRK